MKTEVNKDKLTLTTIMRTQQHQPSGWPWPVPDLKMTPGHEPSKPNIGDSIALAFGKYRWT